MTENHISRRAVVFGQEPQPPLRSTEPVRTSDESSAKEKDEPGANRFEPLLPAETGLPDIVWLTVDEAVAYCDAHGLSRTPMTVRKWAERSFNLPDGDVVSDREDTLWGRYRWKIEAASLTRKVAEELSRERGSDEPVQTGSNADALNTVAKQIAPITEPVRTRSNVIDVRDETDAMATLRAENRELREQQKRDRDEISFLRDEVKFNRSLKTDFAQTSHRLLETLETLAIGGRLKRGKPDAQQPAASPAEPVRYQQPDIDQSAV